jgi:hypothetical protein
VAARHLALQVAKQWNKRSEDTRRPRGKPANFGEKLLTVNMTNIRGGTAKRSSPAILPLSEPEVKGLKAPGKVPLDLKNGLKDNTAPPSVEP